MRGVLVLALIFFIFSIAAVMLWLRERKRVDRISGELDTYYSALKERRRTIRLNKRLDVVCEVIEKPGSCWSVFSKDISGEGICLFLPEILPQDAVVNLEVNMPGAKPITARGQVVWVKELEATNEEGKRQFNAGIKFIKVKPKDKEVLVNFIQTYLKSEGEKA